MKPPRLEHNRFVATDLEECIAFYQSVFGFEISWEGTQPTGERWVHLKLGDMYLSISQCESQIPKRVIPKDSKQMHGYQHMGWVVEDLDEYRNALAEHNVKFAEVQTEVASHIYFFDTENNEIELVRYKRPYVQ